MTMRPVRMKTESAAGCAACAPAFRGPSDVAAPSTASACTGQAAAARSTSVRWRSSGSSSYCSASSPSIENTSGARKTHCP